MLLFAGVVVFTGLFALSQRYGRYPMLTPALARNRQFMGASTSLLLFAIGMMGTMFLVVLLFVNLYGGGSGTFPNGLPVTTSLMMNMALFGVMAGVAHLGLDHL